MYYGLLLVFVIIFFLDKAVFLEVSVPFRLTSLTCDFHPSATVFSPSILGELSMQIYKIIDDHFYLLMTQKLNREFLFLLSECSSLNSLSMMTIPLIVNYITCCDTHTPTYHARLETDIAKALKISLLSCNS